MIFGKKENRFVRQMLDDAVRKKEERNAEAHSKELTNQQPEKAILASVC
jgi:hypothetical protein